MNEELCKALEDYFDVGEFAECLSITVTDLVEMFPDEVEDALDDLKEMIGWVEEDEEDE
jgi:hypothetical protein